MRIIDIDAQHWQSFDDYLDAMRKALGSPERHGNNIDAFLDSMVWGGINELAPPYTIRIKNAHELPTEILEEIELLKKALLEARAESIARRGYDVDVSIEIMPLAN